MSNALEQHRKECREMQLAGMIWWLVLWYASDEGKMEIASEQQWLTCELVATLIEDVEGRKFYYSWRHDRTNRERIAEWDEWPSHLNEQLDKCRAVNLNAFSDASHEGKLHQLLKRFARYNFQTDHGEKDWLSELRWFHENNTPTQAGRSRFVPSGEMYERADAYLCEVREEYPKIFWCVLPGWIHAIATLMRPYIERDVAFIKKHYSW